MVAVAKESHIFVFLPHFHKTEHTFFLNSCDTAVHSQNLMKIFTFVIIFSSLFISLVNACKRTSELSE